MALEPYPGMVPNAYGANTGNVMSFGGGGGAPQVGAPVSGNNDVLGTLAVLSILDELGFRDGDGGPGATGGGPDAAAGVNDNGAVGIGIGPASGSPGTGGLGGLAAGLMGMLGLTTNPIGFMVTAMMNQALGRTPTQQQVMNFINQATGGGNPSAMGMNDDSNAQPGNQATAGNTGIGMGTDADAAQNNAPGQDASPGVTADGHGPASDGIGGGPSGDGSGSGGGSTGGDSGGAAAGGDDGGAGNGDSGAGADGAGFAKGGIVTKSRLKGPNPKGPDDGHAALKSGEGVLNVRAMTKMGADVFQKLNSGDFDPAMLRFAVLRKVSK